MHGWSLRLGLAALLMAPAPTGCQDAVGSTPGFPAPTSVSPGWLRLSGPGGQSEVQVDDARLWVSEAIPQLFGLASPAFQIHLEWEGTSALPPSVSTIERASSAQAAVVMGDETFPLESGTIELSLLRDAEADRGLVVVSGRAVGSVGGDTYEAEFEVHASTACSIAWSHEADTGVFVPEGGTAPSATLDVEWKTPFCQNARHQLGLR